MRHRVVRAATCVLALATLTVAAPASAHHPDVAAVITCDQAQLVVSAWAGRPNTVEAPDANDLSRSNPEVAVAVSVNGGPYVRLSQGDDWAFEAPGYAFSTTVPVPEEAQTVSFEVTTAAPWGTGAPPGDSRATPAVTVPACDEPAVTVSDSGNVPASNPVVAPAAGEDIDPSDDASAGAVTSGEAQQEAQEAQQQAEQGSGTTLDSVTGFLPWVAGALLVAALLRLLVNLAARRRGHTA